MNAHAARRRPQAPPRHTCSARPLLAVVTMEGKSKDELYAVLQNRLQQLSGAMAGVSGQSAKAGATAGKLQELGHHFAGMCGSSAAVGACGTAHAHGSLAGSRASMGCRRARQRLASDGMCVDFRTCRLHPQGAPLCRGRPRSGVHQLSVHVHRAHLPLRRRRGWQRGRGAVDRQAHANACGCSGGTPRTHANAHSPLRHILHVPCCVLLAKGPVPALLPPSGTGWRRGRPCLVAVPCTAPGPRRPLHQRCAMAARAVFQLLDVGVGA